MVKYSMKWLGSRISDRNVPQREAAVSYDQRGASRGTVQSWHGKQCCQEAWAPRDGYSKERPRAGEAVREWWRRRHKSTSGGHLNNIVFNSEKLLAILWTILCTILILILLNITQNVVWNTVNTGNIEQLFTQLCAISGNSMENIVINTVYNIEQY